MYSEDDKSNFVTGTIVTVIGHRTLLVEIPKLQNKWKRHTNQFEKLKFIESHTLLCDSHIKVVGQNSDDIADVIVNNMNSENVVNVEPIYSCRPKRNVKPVNRLMNDEYE